MLVSNKGSFFSLPYFFKQKFPEKILRSGLIKSGIFFQNNKLTPIRRLFRLNKTVFYSALFGFVRLFFRKCFKCLQRVPLHFFSILQKNVCSKTPKGPPFTFFGTMRLTGDQKNFEKNQKN